MDFEMIRTPLSSVKIWLLNLNYSWSDPCPCETVFNILYITL